MTKVAELLGCWVAGVVLVTGCASSTPKKVYPPAPAFDTWTSVPAFVVDAVRSLFGRRNGAPGRWSRQTPGPSHGAC